MDFNRPGTSSGLENLRIDTRLFNALVLKPRPLTGCGAQRQSSLEEKQKRVDKLTRATNLFEAKLSNLNKHIEEVRDKIILEKRKRKPMGGVKACGIVDYNVQKEIRILENRLNKTNIRVCEIEAGCESEKKAINALRLEKLNFDRGYQKLKREFELKKRQMADIIDQSNIAYQAREDALKRLKDLQEDEEEELQKWTREWKELGRMVEEESKVNDYVKQSALKRKEKELTELISQGNLDPEEEAKLRNRLNKLHATVMKQATNIRSSERNIKSYEEAFSKLKQAAGISDVNELVSRFVENEDKNFGIFTHIQEINRENEALEEKIKSLEDEMAKHMEELGQKHNSRERIVQELEEKLTKVGAQNEVYDAKNAMNSRIFELLTSAIGSLFIRVGYNKMEGLQGFRNNEASASSSQLCARLGDRVEQKNLMLYLGVVEQRTNEIIQAFCSSSNRPTSDANINLSTGLPVPMTPTGNNRVEVRPPAVAKDEPDFEAEELIRPMTSDEIREQQENPRYREVQQSQIS